MFPARPGARIYICVCQGRMATNLPAEAKSTPGSPGRGFLCAILADPQTNARAGRNPSLKILPTLPHASARSRPQTAPDASPSCGWPSPTRRRRSRSGFAPGNGGSGRELPHLQAPDTGRGPADRTEGECARGTQYHTGVPFAALPHDIAADPRLSPTDLRVLAALFYFARADASCWPSDAAIAARVHRHPGTVRRALRRLESFGYLRREFTRENPTGRLIHLTCKEPNWPRPVPAPPPVRRRVGGSSAAHGGGERRRTPTET